jgi:archaellum component FlaF (FlaF/FlaG flagellin family)
MAIVTILLVNMLIAMMGNTYQRIAETKNEWQRQVMTKHFLKLDILTVNRSI